nr:hypothetical protein [Aggregatilinea lenta]
MREMGLQRPPPRRRVRTTDSHHPHRRYLNRVAGLTVAHPDQVWVADITHVRLAQTFAYLTPTEFDAAWWSVPGRTSPPTIVR